MNYRLRRMSSTDLLGRAFSETLVLIVRDVRHVFEYSLPGTLGNSKVVCLGCCYGLMRQRWSRLEGLEGNTGSHCLVYGCVYIIEQRTRVGL